jgi:rubrerythrin
MKNAGITLMLLASLCFMTSCGGGSKKVQATKTIENLKAAFKGESTASAKYAAYAAKAKEEGFPQVAVLFEAASKAENIHAGNHKEVLSGLGVEPDVVVPEFTVKTTVENLQDAIAGEGYEMETMYPGFIAAAEEEKVAGAKKSFTWALDTEKKHKGFYQKALDALSANTLNVLATEYFVCPKCGNTFEAATVEEKCSFCMTPKDKYIGFKM